MVIGLNYSYNSHLVNIYHKFIHNLIYNIDVDYQNSFKVLIEAIKYVSRSSKLVPIIIIDDI